MDWQERISIDPAVLGGKPVIKGTRLAVEFIIDLLAQAWTEEEVLANYPGITHEDIQACIAYASTREYVHSQRGKYKGKGLLKALMAEKEREKGQ